jgi:hypothetical protein
MIPIGLELNAISFHRRDRIILPARIVGSLTSSRRSHPMDGGKKRAARLGDI